MPKPTKPRGAARQSPATRAPIRGSGGALTARPAPSAPSVRPIAESAAAIKLLHTVGSRVRQLRKSIALSRRGLSDRSGVSQRYLAQLESGEGNISLTLLLKVARALGVAIEQLLNEEGPQIHLPGHTEDGSCQDLAPGFPVDGSGPTALPASIGALYRNATQRQRQSVVEILTPRQRPGLRGKRIALIGLRGAGKSTLGRQAAATLELPFVELNTEIEQACGFNLREVFGLYGPEGYRLLERQSLEANAASTELVVLAVAGGIIADPGTFDFLLRHYFTIWLKATPEDHMARVKQQGDERPMAGNPQAMAQLRAMLANREATYARADAVIDTSTVTQNDALANLTGLIQQRINTSC